MASKNPKNPAPAPAGSAGRQPAHHPPPPPHPRPHHPGATPGTLDEEALTPLGSCMRGGRDALGKANLLVWGENNDLQLRTLQQVPTTIRQELARRVGTPNRALDEAYSDLLKIPAVAQRTKLAPDFFDTSLSQESAWVQMGAAASGMAIQATGCTRLLCLGLYSANGANEEKVAELTRDPALPWAKRRRLAVYFADVSKLEGALQADASSTRRLSAAQQAELQTSLTDLAHNEQERTDVENLLQAMHDPARAFPPPRTGNKKG